MTFGFNRFPVPLVFLLVLVLLLAGTRLLAHSPKETHSLLMLQEESLLLRLELPWTIMEATKKAYPEIKHDSNKQKLIAYAQRYVQDQLVLSSDGQILQAEKMETLDDGHGHNAIFLFYFTKHELEGLIIKNRVLFNHNKSQKNYHKIIFADGNSQNYVTNYQSPSFQIGDATTMSKDQKSAGLVIAILALTSLPLLIWRWRKKEEQ